MKEIIDYKKELRDSLKLAEMIINDGWLDGNVIIVSCFPDYSNICTQIINHSLSQKNRNELYEQIFLEFPLPTMNQVWDREKKEYELFDRYLARWVKENISSKYKYLFIGNLFYKYFSKLRHLLAPSLTLEDYRIACLYVHEHSKILPDYFIRKYAGDLFFHWENPNS